VSTQRPPGRRNDGTSQAGRAGHLGLGLDLASELGLTRELGLGNASDLAAVGYGDPDAAGRGAMDTDGRRSRRRRNRDAVVDALLDLYRDGNLRPSSCDIAERAGLSARSLFRYFDDVDDLVRAAVSRQLERTKPLLPIDAPAGAPRHRRIDAVVAQRFRLFAEAAPVAKVARLQAPFHPVLATELTRHRSYLRSQLRHTFTDELSAMSPAQASAVLAMVDVVCSFESYELLCEDQTIPVEEAKAMMAGAIDALFTRPDLTRRARVEAGDAGGRP